jgi:excisionase family DNA binding protein
MSDPPTYLRVPRHRAPTPDADRRVFTVEEVALELRVSEATVYRLMRAGRLAYVAVGRRRRVTREQLEAFFEASTVEADAG